MTTTPVLNAEQQRNQRLAERIAAGTAVPDLEEVMATMREMASAYLDVPGPRAAQLCDELDRLRAVVADLQLQRSAALALIERDLQDELRIKLLRALHEA